MLSAAVAAVATLPQQAAALASFRVNNTETRRDTHGNAINAHDGHITRLHGKFYWVGTRYPACLDSSIWGSAGNAWRPDYNGCGFGDHSYAIYESSDLQTWTLLNPSMIPDDWRPVGIYFRPKLLYCSSTKTYVLWFNYVDLQRTQTVLPAATQGVYGVATAHSVAGPYRIVRMNMTMGNGRNLNGDFNIFVDGAHAFILYHSYDWRNPPTPVTNHSMAVDRLTPDFTDTVGAAATSGNFGPHEHDCEAPVLFRSNGGKWYALLSNINVYAFGVTTPVTAYISTSRSALGPWVRHSVVTEPSPPGKPGLGQQSFVLQLNASHWLWGGDRWGSAPVIDSRRWGGTTNNSGVKSMDLYSWVPLVVSDSAPGNSSIEPLKWHDTWELQFSGK